MEFVVTNVPRLSGFVLAAVFVVSLAGEAWAQGPPPGMGPPVNRDAKAEDRGRQVSEGRLRRAELDAAAGSRSEKEVEAAIGRMKQDFTRIQVLRNAIARNLVARTPLDYLLISQQTEEINKRANDLNTFILARAPEEKEQNNPVELQTEEMIGALVKLCKLIDSFTENPALKQAGTVDARGVDKVKEEKARADKDLVAIIKLSETIRRKSDSLRIPK